MKKELIGLKNMVCQKNQQKAQEMSIRKQSKSKKAKEMKNKKEKVFFLNQRIDPEGLTPDQQESQKEKTEVKELLKILRTERQESSL